MISKRCLMCDFYDPDYDCTCPSSEMWYACPLSPDPTPEDFMMEEDFSNGTILQTDRN